MQSQKRLAAGLWHLRQKSKSSNSTGLAILALLAGYKQKQNTANITVSCLLSVVLALNLFTLFYSDSPLTIYAQKNR